MFRQIFDVRVTKVTESAVERDESSLDAFDFHALQHLSGEVETGSRSRDGTFVASKKTLETFEVLRFAFASDKAGNGCFAQRKESTFELIVVTVVKEAKRTSATRRVVNHFGNNGVVFAKVEFVANSDFTSRINQHVPQAEFFVQFSKKEHFDACTGFFLVAIQTSGEDFGVIEDEHIVLVEKTQNVFEHEVLNVTSRTVKHQHSAFVAMRSRIFCNPFFRKFVLEL